MSSSTFNVEGIELPVNTRKEIAPYVPTPGDFLLEGAEKKLVRGVAAAINDRVTVMLKGPTGCGKTALIRYLASKTGNGYLRMQFNGSTSADEFLGRWLINDQGTYWQDGILITAMKLGVWLVLDELNMALPEIHAVLRPVLDDDKRIILQTKDNEVVHAHPDFRIFATINPWQDYAGTKEMNKADKDRFCREFPVSYPDPKQEVKILQKHSGLDFNLGKTSERTSFLERIVEFGTALRKHEEKNEIAFTCSTRQLINLACALKYLGIKDAAECTILNKIEDEQEIKIARTELDKFFSNAENKSLIEMAKKGGNKALEEEDVLTPIEIDSETLEQETIYPGGVKGGTINNPLGLFSNIK